MQSNAARAAIAVLAVAAVIVLFIVLSGDDDESAPTTVSTVERNEDTGKPKDRGEGIEKATDAANEQAHSEVPAIIVKGGQPVDGVADLDFVSGGRVTFEVESDVAEHVHVHGYDVIMDIEPGKPVTFDFPADIEGVFEVELEDSAVQIAEITVSPQ